jgi:hypothetical protein
MFMIGFTVAYHTILSCSSPPPKFWGPGQPPFPIGSAASGAGSGAPGWVWKSIGIFQMKNSWYGSFWVLGPQKIGRLIAESCEQSLGVSTQTVWNLEAKAEFPAAWVIVLSTIFRNMQNKTNADESDPTICMNLFPGTRTAKFTWREGYLTWL